MVWRTEPDLSVMQAFHRRIAGRTTRSQKTWDLLQQEMDAGRGELLVGFFEGALASSALYIDGGDTTIYWSAVYDRSLFPRALTHYGMWLEMERAKARGMKVLELGEVPEPGTASEKEINIGRSKRGFATEFIHVHAMNDKAA